MKKLIVYNLLLFQLCINAQEISTPLIEAACMNNVIALQQLLDKGHDINETNNHGVTPLFAAVYYDALESAKCLIKNNANLEASDALGATPLWIASCQKNLKITRLLLTYGANFLHKRENSSLLETIISDQGYNDILQELVNYGHWYTSDNFDVAQTNMVYPLTVMSLHKLYKNDHINQTIDHIHKEDHITLRNHLLHYATRFLSFDEKMKIFKKLYTQDSQSNELIYEIAQQHAQYYVAKWKQELANPVPVEINQKIITSNMVDSFRLLLNPQPTIK